MRSYFVHIHTLLICDVENFFPMPLLIWNLKGQGRVLKKNYRAKRREREDNPTSLIFIALKSFNKYMHDA